MAITSYVIQEVDDTALEPVEIMKPNPKARPATGSASSSYGSGARSSPYNRVRQQAPPGAVKSAVDPASVVDDAANIDMFPEQPAEPPTVNSLCENFTPVAQDADIDPPLEPIVLSLYTGDSPMSKAIEKFDAVATSCLDQVALTIFYPVHYDDTFVRVLGCPIYKNKAGWYFFNTSQGWFLSTALFDEVSYMEAQNKDCT